VKRPERRARERISQGKKRGGKGKVFGAKYATSTGKKKEGDGGD